MIYSELPIWLAGGSPHWEHPGFYREDSSGESWLDTHLSLPCKWVIFCADDKSPTLLLITHICQQLISPRLPVFVCAAAHLQLLLSLQGELLKRLDNYSRVGAVVDENGRAPHPRLQVVDRQRDVLGVVLKEEKRWESRCQGRGNEGDGASW